MNGISITKALLIPLIVLFGLAGVILMFIGGIQLWKVSGDDVQRDGVYTQLQPFVDCNYVASMYVNSSSGAGGAGAGSSQNQTTDFKNAVTNYCRAQQRPFIWYLSITGSMVAISVLLSLCIGWKVPRSWLYWLAIQNAVTTALLFTLIYVYMRGTAPAYALQDCSGYDASTVQSLQATGLRCWRGPGVPQMRSASRIFHKLLPCLWIGIAFSLFSMFLFDLLLSAIWHGKGRAYYGAGPAGPAAAGPYATGPGVAPVAP